MSDNPSVSLGVMADHVDRYQQDVGEWIPRYVSSEQEDVASALVEAERALRTAARLLRRASKVSAGAR